MRAAVIDIGSSSIKLLIGERDGHDIKILETLKNVVPLGKNTFIKGRISQEIINQTVSVLERYKQTLKEYDIKDVMVIATTAVREARNRDIFQDTVFLRTGFKMEVLNVGDVVYYIDAYLSQKLKKDYPIHEKNLLIAELGAGSLDIAIMEKGYTLMTQGIPIGTLRLNQFMSKLEGSQEEVLETIKEYLENELLSIKKLNPDLNTDDLILIDENYSMYLPNILSAKKKGANFFQLTQAEAEEFLTKLTESTPDKISRSYKVPVESADTIICYALVLNTLFKLIKNDYIYILQASLAQAILSNSLFKAEILPEDTKIRQLVSVAEFLCRKYNADIAHSSHVALLSATLFDALKDSLGLTGEDSLYLILGAYLHDIGMFINNRSHHKHTEYIINSMNLFRLTEEEIKIIACIARYHRRGEPSNTHILYSTLSSSQQILVQKLSSLLRLANALDRSHKQKVKKIEVKFNKRQDVSVTAFAQDNLILERTYFNEVKGSFEEITGNKIGLLIKTQG